MPRETGRRGRFNEVQLLPQETLWLSISSILEEGKRAFNCPKFDRPKRPQDAQQPTKLGSPKRPKSVQLTPQDRQTELAEAFN